jgi:murein DD-endopeptidase MepM/ murein hydrolase activator NlpD
MALARPVAFLSLLLTAPTFAADPHPPQLAVSFLAEPAPIVQDGSTRLVYEMQIVNYIKSAYVLDALEAKAGETDVTFRGADLEAIIDRFGDQGQPVTSANRTIEHGRGVIVFLMLDLGKAQAPAMIEHTLRILDDKGEAHDVALAPLAVSSEPAIVVGPPLRGEWIAGDAVNNNRDAAHRRAVLIVNGRPYVSQRFAIDWVQIQTISGVTTTWKGPEDKNGSYFCYDQPIYSVANGKVVAMSDGAPENVPHSQTYAVPIDFNNAAGNHLVVEIAPRRYVLYAHMRPGTVTVKVGDIVRTGEVLGHVGNTGSSSEPHLHMHIDDEPSFLAGNGLPYEFASGEESGPVEANMSAPTAISFGQIGPLRPFTNDYPAENALVTFK